VRCAIFYSAMRPVVIVVLDPTRSMLALLPSSDNSAVQTSSSFKLRWSCLRWGRERGYVVFGGQKMSIPRPRCARVKAKK
jgi:hypothetical protein